MGGLGELLGELGALTFEVGKVAIDVAREHSETGSVFFECRDQSWREVKSVPAIKSQPPNVIGFAGIGPVANAVLFIVLGAEITEGEPTVDSDVDFLIVVTDSEKRMTMGHSDITAPIAHLAPDCQAGQGGAPILPLNFVRFGVPRAAVPTRSIDNVSVFDRFHSHSIIFESTLTVSLVSRLLPSRE
jgi:hypothetical protein